MHLVKEALIEEIEKARKFNKRMDEIMAEVKFCKDCKWCKPQKLLGIINYYPNSKCHNPLLKTHTDFLVTGDAKDNWFCSIQRGYLGECGREAKYFEPKEKADE
jgi:hypothetical protein